MYRLLRIAGSFAIVLVAYWAYALVAVPLIEPSADPHQVRQISEEDRARAQGRIDAGIAELRDLFDLGAWELKSPKILESQQIKLLMQDYRNLGDGRVEIHPCTMIFTPEGSFNDQRQQRRQAVVLEAPEGAVLEFDGPFDLRRMKIGRLVGGQLTGRITIRSAGKNPGPEDDLLIVTRNVQLTEKNIFTPHTVDFRYGPHYGRGGQMRIKLLPAEQAGAADPRKPGVAGIELFELRRLDRLHLELGDLDLASDKTPPAASGSSPDGPPADPARQATAGSSPRPEDLPVEITCQGPFRFDLIQKVATFEDQVNVLKINPTGPSDQLNCELLSVFFTDRTDPTPNGPDDQKDGGKKRPAGSLNLQAQRIEARGDPVVIHAPSEHVHGRGERLEYDLATRRIVLDGTHEVMLQQAPNEIHARSLQYQPAETQGQLGRVVAKGPGWLRGQMDRRPDQQLEAHWNEQLQVRPHEGNQVISLSGGAGLKFPEIGQLDAGEIHFWLLESESQHPNEQSRLRPDRMLARDRVRIRSAELSAAVEQLEVWFEPDRKAEAGRRAVEETFSGRRHGDPAPVARDLPTAGQPTSPPAARQQHFQISGRLLRARMLLREDGRSGLSELMVEEGVRFVETQTKQPDERPLLVCGDRLHVVDADKPHAAVTVTGEPAYFEGRGLTLTGSNINLNRGTNRLWVDAAGRMDLPMDRDLEGRPLRNPALLKIHWQDSMVFDGRTARFEESVTVTAPHRHLQTETLEVQFKRPINFSDDKIRQDPETETLVEQLRCRGGVFMESVSVDGDEQTSHERMQATDLEVNLDSGVLKARGPGWLTSVRRGSDDPLAGGGILGGGPDRRRAVAERSRTDTDNEEQLRGLHVRFQGSITGNVLPGRREMTFRDHVQAAYAPVDSWAATLDVNDPDSLGPEGAVLHCDRLSVIEMATPDGKRRTMELAAEGNTVVDNSTFTARAARMTYAEAKDLLILEGDGRSDAELFHQPRLGGPISKHAARKIFYWPKTKRLREEGARSFQLDRLPTGDPATR
jgi:lipopolysaccharide export system protein LptA